MPWAPDGVAHDKTVGERAVVVRAVRAHGKHGLTSTHQHDVV